MVHRIQNSWTFCSDVKLILMNKPTIIVNFCWLFVLFEGTRFMLTSRLDYNNTSTLQHSIVTVLTYSTLTHQPKVIHVYLGVYELDKLHVVTETPSMSLLGSELREDSWELLRTIANNKKKKTLGATDENEIQEPKRITTIIMKSTHIKKVTNKTFSKESNQDNLNHIHKMKFPTQVNKPRDLSVILLGLFSKTFRSSFNRSVRLRPASCLLMGATRSSLSLSWTSFLSQKNHWGTFLTTGIVGTVLTALIFSCLILHRTVWYRRGEVALRRGQSEW